MRTCRTIAEEDEYKSAQEYNAVQVNRKKWIPRMLGLLAFLWVLAVIHQYAMPNILDNHNQLALACKDLYLAVRITVAVAISVLVWVSELAFVVFTNDSVSSHLRLRSILGVPPSRYTEDSSIQGYRRLWTCPTGEICMDWLIYCLRREHPTIDITDEFLEVPTSYMQEFIEIAADMGGIHVALDDLFFVCVALTARDYAAEANKEEICDMLAHSIPFILDIHPDELTDLSAKVIEVLEL